MSREPSAHILVVADIVEGAVNAYVGSLRGPYMLPWEAPIEGFAISMVMVRHIEAVLLMARKDEVFALPALTVSRAAFEHAVRACWLLHPSNPYESEARWLAFLSEREKLSEYLAEQNHLGARERHESIAKSVADFRQGVLAKLPAGIHAIAKTPTIKAMLDDLGNSQMYALYRTASQPVHGTTHATSSFIRDLGNAKEIGEFVTTADWVLPLRLCWLSLKEVSHFVCDRLGMPESRRPDLRNYSTAVDQAMMTLASAFR